MSSDFEILRLYGELDKAKKRIAELETENGHLQNCMVEDDERIAELEAHISQAVEMGLAYTKEIEALEGRIAELEQAKEYYRKQNDRLWDRVRELEGFLQKFVYLMGYGAHRPGDDYLWIADKQKEALDLLNKNKC